MTLDSRGQAKGIAHMLQETESLFLSCSPRHQLFLLPATNLLSLQVANCKPAHKICHHHLHAATQVNNKRKTILFGADHS